MLKMELCHIFIFQQLRKPHVAHLKLLYILQFKNIINNIVYEASNRLYYLRLFFIIYFFLLF